MIPPPPFQNLIKIREYLSGDRIQCLVCGRRYLRLTYSHLLRHDMSLDDYREQFGIPWTYSLTSRASRANTGRVHKAVNKAYLKYPRKGPQGKQHRRQATAAERNYWREVIRPQGPLNSAQARVTVPCDDCGVGVPTTRLTRVHGTRCIPCRRVAKELRDRVKQALKLPRCA